MEICSKETIDLACREYIIDIVSRTKHRYNDDLKSFILNDLVYEKALMVAVTEDFRYLEEDATELYDPREIDKLSNHLMGAGGLMFSVYAGSHITGAVTGAMSAIGMAKLPGASIVSFLMGGKAMAYGRGLLFKVTKLVAKKLFDDCARLCRKRFKDSDSRDIGASMDVCSRKCRIAAINQVVRKLQSSLIGCPKTKNPDNCKAYIHSRIAHFKKQVASEREGLVKSQSKLVKRN